ncbi:MAG: nucleotidyltransferase family protein [Legionellaceae bacterium]|nr:nucleotidyltransferase family protein [Legionellaceae bacterium]
MEKTAIILAGGLGTRLRTVVQDRPKPMALINDRPFLAHQLDYWIAEGVEKFILSVGYKHEMIIDYFQDKYNGAKIDYAIEHTPMGTGGGLVLALQKINDERPFLLLNGDTYFTVNLNNLEDFSKKNDSDLTFSLFHTNDAKRYMGIDINNLSEVIALQSTLKNQPEILASGGVYWVSNTIALKNAAKIFNGPSSFENDILPQMLNNGSKLFGFACDGDFIDIGLPDDYYRSSSILEKQKELI